MLSNKFGIYYYVRPSSVDGKKGRLYLRITTNGQQISLSIPSLKLFYEDFDVRRQKVNQSCDLAVQIIDFMNGMNALLNDMYLDFERKRKKITKEDIQRLIPRVGGGFTVDYPSLLTVWKEFLLDQQKQVGTIISKGTYDIRGRYKNVLTIALNEISLDTKPLCNFDGTDIERLQIHLLSKFKKGYAGRIMAAMNMVLGFAIKRGYIEKNPYQGVRRIQIDKAPNLVWLEPDEIKAFADLDLSGAVEEHRDAFLFCCWTGLAIGDYELLNPATQQALIQKANSPKNMRAGTISQKKSGLFLEGRRRKTGTLYRVPLNPEARAILAKYGGVQYLPYNLSQSGMVLNLLAKTAGIEKELRFHVARKTFANHLLNVVKMNPFYVIKIMGWSKIEEAKPYVEISDETLAYQLFFQGPSAAPSELADHAPRPEQKTNREEDFAPFTSGVFLVHKTA